jgi:hypothetical protein
MKQTNLIKKLVGKCVLLVFLVIMVMASSSMLWETYTSEVAWENDEAIRISRCETYLREKQYGKLWEYMNLFNLNGKRYEVYWDAVDKRLQEIQQQQDSSYEN